MNNPQALTGKTLLLVTMILLAGLAARSYKAGQIEKIPHDDVISYMVATAHLDDYHQTISDLQAEPRWLENRVWRDYLRPGPEPMAASLAETIHNLQQHDIHPPVYFLWLNLVLRALPDTGPWSGWLSNAVFYVLNGILLFQLGRRLLPSQEAAGIGLLIWAVATPSIQTSIIARHYELMASIGLLSVLVLARTSSRQNLDPLSIVLFGALTLIGFLTNYQYLYLGAALSCTILLLHYRQPGRVFACGIAIGGGVLLGLWLYPALLLQSQEVRAWSAELNPADILFRLRNTLEEPLKFCLFATLTVLYLVTFARRQGKLALGSVPTLLYCLVGLNFAFIAAAYLGFIAPKHAMGGRYLATLWPLLALLLGQLIHPLWQQPAYRYAAIVLICLPGVLLLNKPEKNPGPPAAIAEHRFIIADFNERGIWPAIAHRLPADQLTLVAPQSSLLQHQGWQTRLSTMQAITGTWVSSAKLGDNSRSKQQSLRQTLDATFQTAPIKHRDRGLAYFQLNPSTGPAQ